MAVTLEYIVFTYEYFVIACTLAFGVGIYCILISVTEEIQHILHLINSKAQANKVKPDKLNTLFLEYINTHGTVKQLSISITIYT